MTTPAPTATARDGVDGTAAASRVDAARAELDYSHTIELLRTLTHVRFKLLTFLPTIAGAAVALLGRDSSAAELIAVGAIGLTATAGLAAYELRNAELYDYALTRAAGLEDRIGVGLYRERPRPGRANHDRALALVYGAAVGGWTYLLAWGLLHAVGLGHPRDVGGIVGVAAGVAVVAAFAARLDSTT